MEKRSTFSKIIVLVMIALMLPMVASAMIPICGPTYCNGCQGGQVDCTSEWIWANLEAALILWYSGYSILVCCE